MQKSEGRPTLDDVARRSQVSRQTVSNVLNAPERVRSSTRQRVQAAIDALGYEPHRGARLLKSQRTGLIAYRVPPAGEAGPNPLLDRFLHALCDAARTRGFHVLLVTPAGGQTEVELQRELIRTRTVDAFVVAETNYGDPRIVDLIELGFPFVAFGRSAIERPHAWVDVDGAAGTATAVGHLRAAGRERIAFLGWPDGSLIGDDRLAGYRRGLATAGLEDDPALVSRSTEGIAAGAQATTRLLDLPRPPDAIVATSDLLAAGALRAARERRVSVGRKADLAVIGFDDSSLAPHLDPPLTSLRQPLAAVADRLVEMLDGAVEGGKSLMETALLAPTLVTRTSA